MKHMPHTTGAGFCPSVLRTSLLLSGHAEMSLLVEQGHIRRTPVFVFASTRFWDPLKLNANLIFSGPSPRDSLKKGATVDPSSQVVPVGVDSWATHKNFNRFATSLMMILSPGEVY